MKKKGRPKTENYKDVNQIIEAYHFHKNFKTTADALCINVKTLKRILKENNIPFYHQTPEDIRKYGAMSRRTGCFAKWLKEHPNEKLPPNMKEIHRITKCPYDSIKSYFRYRKEKIKEVLKSLPSIKGLDADLKDTLGNYIPTKSIKSYAFRINKFSCDVYMILTLKDGTITECHIDNIKEFQKKIERVLE